MNSASTLYKIPVSVLVVIWRFDSLSFKSPKIPHALLIERADHPGFWQSVTGSLDAVDEPLLNTCSREVLEETGIECPVSSFIDLGITNKYSIYPHWQKRYAPGVTENTEHVFAVEVAGDCEVILNPREHTRFRWVPLAEAAWSCFSWSNCQAIKALDSRLSQATATHS